jgi:hypothetical protein
MVSFFNEFITYILLVIIMGAVAVCGVLTGRKLRNSKDAKKAAADASDSGAKEA